MALRTGETTAGATSERLASFFGSKSVALIGATEKSLWSVYTYQNLKQFSPDVKVHVVHPRHQTIHGQTAASSLTAIGEPVELAYVMVPTEAALEVVEQAADYGITNIVMLTAGFGEAGEVGIALEHQLIELATARGLSLLGPNGVGFINAAGSVTPYGLPIAPPLRGGPVGFVLQSGGLASSVLAGVQSKGVGISKMVSTGNEAMMSATDIMRHLVEDDDTKVIAAFLETIRQPDEFREVAEAALAAGKPLVVMKVGRTEAGQRSALAHTGALAGDDKVVDAAFRELDVVRVDSLEEMISTAGYLGYYPKARGRRLAVVHASGGACDITADRATDEGLELPEFPAETLAELEDFLPAFSNPHNPLDVTGYVVVDPTLLPRGLQIVGKTVEGNYDLLVFPALLPANEPPDPTAFEAGFDQLVALMNSMPIPLVMQAILSADQSTYVRKLLADRGLFIQDGIDNGMRVLGRAALYHERRDQLLAAGKAETVPTIEVPAGATGVWPEYKVRELLAAQGIPLVPGDLAHSAAEAATIAAGLGGGSVVLKVASADLAHKSDVGGVRLNVPVDSAAEAYEGIVAAVSEARPDAKLDGVLVGPMRGAALEMLVGITTDEGWGKVLTVGLGGIWVEILKDVSLRVLPVTTDEISAMLSELRGAELLRGARGSAPVDWDALVAVIDQIARFAQSLGDTLDTLEINPIRVDGSQIEVLDALAVWRD